jgi:hypothetical protein
LPPRSFLQLFFAKPVLHITIGKFVDAIGQQCIQGRRGLKNQSARRRCRQTP